MVVLVLALYLPATASAHSRLFTASPAPEAVVGGQFTDYQLVFTEQISDLEVEIVDPEGSAVRVLSADAAGLVVDFRADALELPGSHTVTYRAASADGHPVEGSFAFVYRPGAAEPQIAVGRSEAERDGGGGAPRVALAAGILILLAAAVIGGRRLRARGNHTTV